MDSTTPLATDPLPAVVAWIEKQLEKQLGQPLTLEQVAAHAGLSAHHFSRLFTARMGRSVMAYVRGRRLVRGASRLCVESDLKLVDLAFDCGFDSQEAFTRAFKRLFGVPPGRFRRGFAVEPSEASYLMTHPATRNTAVARLPGLATIPAFLVAGPTRRFDQTTQADIPKLWAALVGALPFAGQTRSWASYGVVSSVDRDEGSFQYLAGVGVDPDCVPPPGFATLEIPAATYAVFRITLDGGPLHPQVKQAMASIWGELIPTSGLKVVAGPDFELMDGRHDLLAPGSFIDFHVPVES